MKIAYFDHSYHKKTLSTQFLADLLKKNGASVDFIWDESWHGGKRNDLDEYIGEYDAFIFFQMVPKASKPYYELPINATFIPMLDSFGNENTLHYHRGFWRDFAKVKILSFSKALHFAATSHGLASKYVQYYSPPKTLQDNKPDELGGFFWQRNANMIDWKIVKSLIGDAKFNNLHMHCAADPGAKSPIPSNADIKRYNISHSDWFSNRDEYYSKILQNKVYFAPRLSEGIGMSFLEAMSLGRCVVAPNYGTMNDYIIDGLNGLLYDPKDPRPLDFSKVDMICDNAHITAEQGYKNWLNQEQNIVDFIFSDPAQKYYEFYGSTVDFSELARGTNYSNYKKSSKISKLVRKFF